VAGICWLASYPKSGNTWLRAFLANLFSGERLPERPVPINELSRYCIADDFVADYARVAGRPAEALSQDALLRLRSKVHAAIAAGSPRTVFVKTHNAAISIAGISLITPAATAGAIYVIRNPLDVAVSYAHHFQVPLPRAVAQMCDARQTLPPADGLMRRYLGGWSGHVRSWTRAEGLRILVLRYEDLVAAPSATFGQIVSFLGLPEDPARLERAVDFSSFDQLRRQEAAGGFDEARPDDKARFFRQGKAGAWREALDRDQVARLIEAHRETMTHHGYLSPAGAPI